MAGKSVEKSKNCSEHEFAMKIMEFRSQQPLYVGESFDAIVGYQANGAIIHYKPDAKNRPPSKPRASYW